MRMLQQKNLFSVENCGLKWHPDGTFLCLQFNKIHGKKRTACLELFRLKERDVPSETVEFPDTKVIEFTWEPKGDRFAVVHTTTNTFRSTVSFYTMGDSKHELLCTWCGHAGLGLLVGGVHVGGGSIGCVAPRCRRAHALVKPSLAHTSLLAAPAVALALGSQCHGQAVRRCGVVTSGRHVRPGGSECTWPALSTNCRVVTRTVLACFRSCVCVCVCGFVLARGVGLAA
jgi:hypothetical protein